MKRIWIGMVVILLGIAFTACSAADQGRLQVSAGQGGAGQGQRAGQTLQSEGDLAGNGSQTADGESLSWQNAEAQGASALDAAEIAGLLYIREEEKLARDVYLYLAETWGMNVFSNIASSERVHLDAVLNLIEASGLVDPAAGMERGEFTNPDLQALYVQLVDQGGQSLPDALLVGGAIEEIDIIDLREHLAQASDPALIQVYQNLLSGSINHLAGFSQTYQRQTGEAYQPQYLSLDLYQELLSQASTGGNAAGGRSMGMNSSQGRGRGNR